MKCAVVIRAEPVVQPERAEAADLDPPPGDVRALGQTQVLAQFHGHEPAVGHVATCFSWCRGVGANRPNLRPIRAVLLTL